MLEYNETTNPKMSNVSAWNHEYWNWTTLYHGMGNATAAETIVLMVPYYSHQTSPALTRKAHECDALRRKQLKLNIASNSIGAGGGILSSLPIIGAIFGGVSDAAKSGTDIAASVLEKKQFEMGCDSVAFDEIKGILSGSFDEQSDKLKKNFDALSDNLDAIHENAGRDSGNWRQSRSGHEGP